MHTVCKKTSDKVLFFFLHYFCNYPIKIDVFYASSSIVGVHCKVYSVHCTMYTVQCALYNVYCILHIVQ